MSYIELKTKTPKKAAKERTLFIQIGAITSIYTRAHTTSTSNPFPNHRLVFILIIHTHHPNGFWSHIPPLLLNPILDIPNILIHRKRNIE
jgi:hypothetical protein